MWHLAVVHIQQIIDTYLLPIYENFFLFFCVINYEVISIIE